LSKCGATKYVVLNPLTLWEDGKEEG